MSEFYKRPFFRNELGSADVILVYRRKRIVKFYKYKVEEPFLLAIQLDSYRKLSRIHYSEDRQEVGLHAAQICFSLS